MHRKISAPAARACGVVDVPPSNHEIDALLQSFTPVNVCLNTLYKQVRTRPHMSVYLCAGRG
jgi:hypothetical protein